jgi:hypothetical protein
MIGGAAKEVREDRAIGHRRPRFDVLWMPWPQSPDHTRLIFRSESRVVTASMPVENIIEIVAVAAYLQNSLS